MCYVCMCIYMCSMYIVPIGKTFGRLRGTEMQQPQLSWGVESGTICFPLESKIMYV